MGMEPPSQAPGRRKARNRKSRARPLAAEPTLEALPLSSAGVEGPFAGRDTSVKEPAGWEVVLHDVPRRSFVSIVRGKFATEVLRGWEAMLLKQIPWSRPLQSKRSTGEARPMPRRACWLTREGCSCRYEYG